MFFNLNNNEYNLNCKLDCIIEMALFFFFQIYNSIIFNFPHYLSFISKFDLSRMML